MRFVANPFQPIGFKPERYLMSPQKQIVVVLDEIVNATDIKELSR